MLKRPEDFPWQVKSLVFGNELNISLNQYYQHMEIAFYLPISLSFTSVIIAVPRGFLFLSCCCQCH